MEKLKLNTRVRIEYPTIPNSYHKYHCMEGILLEYINDDTVRVDITNNREWILSHVQKECRYQKMDEYKVWNHPLMKCTLANFVTIVCPAIYVRKHMILIVEDIYLDGNSPHRYKRRELEDTTCIRYPNPGGVGWKSDGMFSFLHDTFDRLIAGEKVEEVYKKGRWDKPYYIYSKQLTPDSIRMYNDMRMDNIGIDFSFLEKYRKRISELRKNY